ncbi:hypothetical protein [Phenylobacterium sp.]|uniref:hypothetical protein n=1 Tax=Phenylobacterium sp. TaxID=1871053 RepID=UPI0035B2E77C
MTTDYLGAQASDNSQNLAMLGYALLFASIFFAGFPALIAVVIAYSQRGAASGMVGSHFAFQIRIFWVAFAVSLAAAACGLAGVIGGLGEVLAMAEVTGLDHLETLEIQLQDITIGARVIALLALALVLGFLSSLWLLCAPAVGFIRLASERPMGDSARP